MHLNDGMRLARPVANEYFFMLQKRAILLAVGFQPSGDSRFESRLGKHANTISGVP